MKEPFKTLSEWERVASDNEPGFLEFFSKGGWTLTKISWNSEIMHFVYVVDDGLHIADTVKIKEWLKFYKQNK